MREVAKNKGQRRYRAVDADDRVWRRSRRPKTCLLAQRPELRAVVAAKLAEDWSPEQIAGWLAKKCPNDPLMRVSHETRSTSRCLSRTAAYWERTCRSICAQDRPIRRSVHNTMTGQWRAQIRDAISIHQRPSEVHDRTVPGHWEGDLLLGRHWTQGETLVECSTRFTVLVQLDNREMGTVTEGLRRTMTPLPEHLRRSLTWDRGMELADHKSVTVNTGMAVYFADPRSPWQRGTNENTGCCANTCPRGRAWRT
jgi:IS30 family transposase